MSSFVSTSTYNKQMTHSVINLTSFISENKNKGVFVSFALNGSIFMPPQHKRLNASNGVSLDCVADSEIKRMRESYVRLDEIAVLPNNWNGNGASPFSESIVTEARELVRTLSVQPIILPTGRDSIQMEYENESGDYLEFELFEDGRLKMFSLAHDGTHETKEISSSSADKVVCDFYGRNI